MLSTSGSNNAQGDGKMTKKTVLGSTLVAGIGFVLALSGCGGGGGTKSGATKSANACSDYERVVSLDNSSAGGSITLYSQMRDGYQRLQHEAPSSLHSDLQVLVDDEQQLAKNGTDSSSQNAAAQAAAAHLDSVLGPMCSAASGTGAPAASGSVSSQSSAGSDAPGLDVCANLRKYVGSHNPFTTADCPGGATDNGASDYNTP